MKFVQKITINNNEEWYKGIIIIVNYDMYAMQKGRKLVCISIAMNNSEKKNNYFLLWK